MMHGYMLSVKSAKAVDTSALCLASLNICCVLTEALLKLSVCSSSSTSGAGVSDTERSL